MKIQSTTPYAFTANKFIIPNNKMNKSVDFLYNKVSKIVKENHVPANFNNDKIVITAEKDQARLVKAGLEESKVGFITDFFEKAKK